jgi:hypothetical protein
MEANKKIPYETIQVDLSKYREDLEELAEKARQGAIYIAIKKTVRSYGGVKVISVGQLNVDFNEEVAIIPLKRLSCVKLNK